MNVKVTQSRWIPLVLRFYLEDHLVFIRCRIDGGDLPRTVGIIQRVLNLLNGDTQRGCFIAIYFDVELRVLDLNVGGHIQQLGQCRYLFLQ